MTTTAPAKEKRTPEVEKGISRWEPAVLDYDCMVLTYGEVSDSDCAPTADKIKELPAATTCIHHWIIQPALGPTSKGVCKRCGAEKIFQNYWDDDAALGGTSFLLNYRRVDSIYDRDRDAEFIKDIGAAGEDF
jgi:hypothetical protein